MATVSELDAMKLIDETLSGVSDPSARDRILRWALAKFSSTQQTIQIVDNTKATSKNKSFKTKRSIKKASKLPSYTLLKELNLTPSGKKSFDDFVNEKLPLTYMEKCVVCVYYITNELEQPVSTNHVFTCFKLKRWRVPANLENTLQYISSQRGWLDTANMIDIKITQNGVNFVEYDLPTKKEKIT